jgi:proline-specific peptidase
VRVSVGDARLFVEVNGAEWALDRNGLHRRPVVIALHGGPGLDATKMRHQLAPLADVAQLIVPDQRGHGRSDLSTSDRWNVATWALDVKRLSDALGMDHPVVFGSSFGGFVAQQYAATYPDHPAGLIVASAAPRFADSGELVERFREVGGEEAAEVVRRDLEQSSEETNVDWMRVCGPLLTLRDDPDPLIAAADAARIQTMNVNVHWVENEGKKLDLRESLGEVRCPTLVLVGERDPLVPVHLAQEVVDAIPRGLARLVVVPDASHNLVTDNPGHVYRCIREFIADLTSPSAQRM